MRQRDFVEDTHAHRERRRVCVRNRFDAISDRTRDDIDSRVANRRRTADNGGCARYCYDRTGNRPGAAVRRRGNLCIERG